MYQCWSWHSVLYSSFGCCWQWSIKPNSLLVNRYLYAAYLKGKKTTRKSTCCACCSWWCCKGGRGCAEVFCLQTDCVASCLQTCASCCPTRIPDITNFGVAQFSHKYPYVQRWYNVLQFTKGNIQWVSSWWLASICWNILLWVCTSF